MSERLDNSVIKELYDSNRSYRIIETCHDISFNPETKHFTPDAYAFALLIIWILLKIIKGKNQY
jgi:hypothetical protein